ncbi:MAG TPA: energy transducer TonB [Pyrinomonadaceae bacterium]|nr:energy transducer TonB [Pyrinomonadaceae bacterium]
MKFERALRVTIIDNANLLERLARELRFGFHHLRLAWPALKRDPIGFSRRTVVDVGLSLRHAAAPDSLAAVASAFLVVLSSVLILVFIGNGSKRNHTLPRERGELLQIVEFIPNTDRSTEDYGVGAGTQGRVGLANAKGEGSATEPRKARGGGNGGQHDSLPAQVGKPPHPSAIPAPIPKFPPARPQALPVAGIDIDAALWKNLPTTTYGDPRSNSATLSNGPGNGGGIGTTNGSGIGEGLGPGFGPGRDGNTGGGSKSIGNGGFGGSRGGDPDPDWIYPVPQVTERARVLAKPEPQYTEEARRNAITGSVVLRVVFSRTGEVTNIRAIQSLPFGLTERAIAAARLIRFRPATRDGRPVNVYMQLEYNFNVY